MGNRNIPSPDAATLDTLICGFIIGMVTMGLVSWLIGAALVGAAGHGDWIIGAGDALRWMVVTWMLGCGQGFCGGWWYHCRMPAVKDRTGKTKATPEVAASKDGRGNKASSLYVGRRRLSRRNENVGNDHRRVGVC